MSSYEPQKRWKTAHNHGLNATEYMKCVSDSKASPQRLHELHPTTQPQAQKDKISSPDPNIDENLIAHPGLRLFIVAIIINLTEG